MSKTSIQLMVRGMLLESVMEFAPLPKSLKIMARLLSSSFQDKVNLLIRLIMLSRLCNGLYEILTTASITLMVKDALLTETAMKIFSLSLKRFEGKIGQLLIRVINCLIL